MPDSAYQVSNIHVKDSIYMHTMYALYFLTVCTATTGCTCEQSSTSSVMNSASIAGRGSTATTHVTGEELISHIFLTPSIPDSVKGSPLPTLSSSPRFEPSRDVTIPIYGVTLAIVGIALLFLACGTLTVVPLYLYMKKRIRSHQEPATITLEVCGIHVSLHSLE